MKEDRLNHLRAVAKRCREEAVILKRDTEQTETKIANTEQGKTVGGFKRLVRWIKRLTQEDEQSREMRMW